MSVQGIRAEIVKTIHEGGLTLNARSPLIDGLGETVLIGSLRAAPLVFCPGSMLIIVVDENGSRTFTCFESNPEQALP